MKITSLLSSKKKTKELLLELFFGFSQIFHIVAIWNKQIGKLVCLSAYTTLVNHYETVFLPKKHYEDTPFFTAFKNREICKDIFIVEKTNLGKKERKITSRIVPIIQSQL